MKRFIDGRLYDTEKAEKVTRKAKGIDMYRTDKGNWFYYYYKASMRCIVTLTKTEAKDIIGNHLGPEVYEKYFGKPEEA